MVASDFRLQARRALSGKWFVAAIASMIASTLGAANGFGFSFDFSSMEAEEMPESFEQGAEQAVEALLPYLGMIIIAALCCVVITVILGSVVSVGYAEFNLDLVDKFTPRISTLFSHFNQLKSAVCASLMIFVQVFVGLILFVIPGIILSYRYAMTWFVLAENPGISAREAMAKSRDIMWHNKWKLFCLDFSFIGWNLLCAITFGIASIWVVPYQQAARAAFYREASKEVEYFTWAAEQV